MRLYILKSNEKTTYINKCDKYKIYVFNLIKMSFKHIY